MKPIVLIPEAIATEGIDLLEEYCTCVGPWMGGNGHGLSIEAKDVRSQAEAIIVRLAPVTATDISEMERLRVVVKHGVGTESIDCDAATARNVQVVITPGGVTISVAEHTTALILALSRCLEVAFEAARGGAAPDRSALTGVELAGKSLGIVGFGRIGQRVARIASAGFEMHVRVHDPEFAGLAQESGYLVDHVLDSMIEQVDFLSLHVPLTLENRHLLDEARLKRLTPTACVVNTARGGLIDEMALVEALTTGSIGGAALDVTETEPLPPDHPLRTTPRTILTPHIGSATSESLARTAVAAANTVIGVLRGDPVEGLVNPGVLR